MKRYVLSILALGIGIVSYGQSNYIKSPSLGIQFAMYDFQSATDLRSMGLSNSLNSKQFLSSKRMSPGLAINYIQGLSNNLDFAATLSGAFLKYPVPDRSAQINDHFLLDATAVGNLKLLSDKYYVNPFITAGVGASKYKGYYSAFVPVGLGLQIKVVNDVFVMANSQYRLPVTENAAYHFYHAIGIVKSFPKPVVVVPVVEIPVITDRDGDGIPDIDDKCPDVPGLAALQGCPDRDGDGIADGDDKCPDVAGLAKYQGCPIPDTDGDGINDELDKCPNVKGFARYQGCPIPDTDGDGVNDEEDKCPTRPGPVSNQGCPEIAKEVIEKINFAAKNVFFSTGSYKLLAKSNKSLDAVVSLLKADESLMIDIDGHTDSQGSDELNQTLSDNRAAAVKNYFISKGIDASRLKSTGFGETKPVADNKTAAGRAKNRRTEMTVRNF